MSKLILDLCGGSGSWSAPYKAAGYEVILVTLPLNDVRDFYMDDDVYGILAAPPCTMFSLARTRAKTPRDTRGALSVVDACLRQIIRYKPKFWALENPQGLLRHYLGAPRITVQPYWFGDRHSKTTDLWGDFNIPKFSPCRLDPKEIHAMKMNTRALPDYGLTRADARAVTPKEFAKAFFEANP